MNQRRKSHWNGTVKSIGVKAQNPVSFCIHMMMAADSECSRANIKNELEKVVLVAAHGLVAPVRNIYFCLTLVL